MRLWSSLSSAALLAAVLSTVPAFAQSVASENAAAADALFREGKALMKEGKYDEACPKLAASNDLDPGAGTLLNLGDCHEKAGKTASAWAGFLEAARLAQKGGDKEREEAARARAAALEPRLVKLRIDVPDATRVPGVVVKRDGVEITAGTWGSAIPVDPGKHQVSVSAPGHVSWSDQIEVSVEGRTVTLTVPALVPVAAAPPPPVVAEPAAAAPVAAAPAEKAPAPVDRDVGSDQRTAALVVGGVGVVGVVVGTIFGLGAKAKWDSADCPDAVCKTKDDQTKAEDAATRGNLSTLGFVVGGAAIAVGTVLYFTAPSAPSATTGRGFVRVAPSFARSEGGLLVDGAF